MVDTKPGLSKLDLAVLGVLLLVVVLIFNRGGGGSSAELIPPGTPLPELMAEGWLNVGSPDADADDSPKIPSRENLAGQVVVVDFWATWCGPCRASLPKLAKIHEHYEPLGVKFIGLTPETADEQAVVSEFIGTVDGFTWPVGFGANPTLDILGVQFLPTIAVFGRDGRAKWSSSSTSGLEVALDEALAR